MSTLGPNFVLQRHVRCPQFSNVTLEDKFEKQNTTTFFSLMLYKGISELQADYKVWITYVIWDFLQTKILENYSEEVKNC